jgi:hypothetical protein
MSAMPQPDASRRHGYSVSFTDKGKLILPDPPAADDVAGQSEWLTVALARDPRHPIIGGEWQGHSGPTGHVELKRRAAPALRFEPARAINSRQRLIEALSWQRIRTDAAPYAYSDAHCVQIAYVVGCLADAEQGITEAEEMHAVLAAFLDAAACREDFSIAGTPGQRYEAAQALKRERDDYGNPRGPARYLLDANTGELIVPLADLEAFARRSVGSLERGWVVGRMAALGFRRQTVQGYALSGREGRKGPHNRIVVLHGHLPHDDEEGGEVRALRVGRRRAR